MPQFINPSRFLSDRYPCFENPYPMDIHESPVTAVLYLSDCPPDLIPAFYSVGSKQKKTGFSERVCEKLDLRLAAIHSLSVQINVCS